MVGGLLETYSAGNFHWLLLRSKAAGTDGTEEAGVGRRDLLRKTLTWRVAPTSPALLEAFEQSV